MITDFGAEMSALKAASADLQSRARSMNSSTFDNMSTNTRMIEVSHEANRKFHNASIHAANMAIDVLRGR